MNITHKDDFLNRFAWIMSSTHSARHQHLNSASWRRVKQTLWKPPIKQALWNAIYVFFVFLVCILHLSTGAYSQHFRLTASAWRFAPRTFCRRWECATSEKIFFSNLKKSITKPSTICTHNCITIRPVALKARPIQLERHLNLSLYERCLCILTKYKAAAQTKKFFPATLFRSGINHGVNLGLVMPKQHLHVCSFGESTARISFMNSICQSKGHLQNNESLTTTVVTLPAQAREYNCTLRRCDLCTATFNQRSLMRKSHHWLTQQTVERYRWPFSTVWSHIAVDYFVSMLSHY